MQTKVNNNMASAYRPRHKTNNNKNKYQHLYNWYPLQSLRIHQNTPHPHIIFLNNL